MKSQIVKDYNETIAAEMTSRLMEACEADMIEWVGYGDINGIDVKVTYFVSEKDQAENDNSFDLVDWEGAISKIEEIDEDEDVVRTLWEK